MSAYILEAPQEMADLYILKYNFSLFIAGSISNARNWQQDLIDSLSYLNICIFNPRRDNFDTSNVDASIKQIKWEYKYLQKAQVISFWFSNETVAPITLFELGCYLDSKKKIFVGIDPDYPRKLDVQAQLKLRNSSIHPVYSIEDLANQIIDFHDWVV